MKPAIRPALIMLLVGGLSSCKKKDDTKFTITINDTPVHLSETGVTATYYPQAQFLYIKASEQMFLDLSVYLDAASPVKNYVFEPNGSNAASIQLGDGSGVFMSDNNVADAGGSFSLTAFDTVGKILSFSFRTTCYAGDRAVKKIVSSTITNLSFKVDTLRYRGNSMSCTVNGVKATNWQTQTGAYLSNFSNGLTFKFTSSSVPRGLYFNIPFGLGPGTFSMYPGAYGSAYNPGKAEGAYVIDSVYYPTSGTINITRLEVAQRKFEASFNLNVQDSRGDRIQITNGSFVINTWKDYE
jgi:hypothetical protein